MQNDKKEYPLLSDLLQDATDMVNKPILNNFIYVIPRDISRDRHELIIKSFLEPVFNHVFRTLNQIIPLLFPGVCMVVTGGDAINYYVRQDDQTPSHDWDIRIINPTDPNFPWLISNNALKREIDPNYLKLRDAILNVFKDAFNAFMIGQRELKKIENNRNELDDLGLSYILDTEFFVSSYSDDKNWSSRQVWLSTLQFKFQHDVYEVDNNGQASWVRHDTSNSIIDISIYGEGVMDYQINNEIEMGHYNNKYKNLKLPDGKEISIDDIAKRLTKSQPTLIYKTIESYITDKYTGVSYMTIGDLINDTIRMIILSSHNHLILKDDYNMKLERYINKYITQK